MLTPQNISQWGRMPSCGGLVTRRRRLPIGAQTASLPHYVCRATHSRREKTTIGIKASMA
jgi:hypothetical protein